MFWHSVFCVHHFIVDNLSPPFQKMVVMHAAREEAMNVIALYFLLLTILFAHTANSIKVIQDTKLFPIFIPYMCGA